MGNNTSLTIEETNRIQNETKCMTRLDYLQLFLKNWIVSVRHIKRIHNRFSKLDRNEKGFVSPQDFAALPEVNKSNLSKENIWLEKLICSKQDGGDFINKRQETDRFSKIHKGMLIWILENNLKN